MSAVCSKCGRALTEGESAWADDWSVVDIGTGRARREVRYTCDDCAEVAAC